MDYNKKEVNKMAEEKQIRFPAENYQNPPELANLKIENTDSGAGRFPAENYQNPPPSSPTGRLQELANAESLNQLKAKEDLDKYFTNLKKNFYATGTMPDLPLGFPFMQEHEDPANLKIEDEKQTIELRNCLICKQPLADWQQNITSQRIHKDGPCINCKYCEKPVGLERILRCLDHEDPVSHLNCLDEAMEKEFQARPVTITQGHLNYLNRVIQFAYRPNPLISLEENCKNAIDISNQNIKDMSMEDKFKHLKMMQAACANVSIAIDNDKEKIQLRVEREDIERHVKIRDLQKIHDIGYQREKEEHDKELSLEKKRIAADPALRAREKTIEGLVKIGFSRELAIEFIDKNKSTGLGLAGSLGKEV